MDLSNGKSFSDYATESSKRAQTELEYNARPQNLNLTPDTSSGVAACQGESIAINDSPGFCWCAITEETLKIADSASCAADSCELNNATAVTDRSIEVHGQSFQSARFCKCNIPVSGEYYTCGREKTCSSLCPKPFIVL